VPELGELTPQDLAALGAPPGSINVILPHVKQLPNHRPPNRGYYADVTCGQRTAVFIFMVGSVFSARYSVAARRGGLPAAYSAVNLALYERGRPRAWVLSEYASARLEGGDTLRIGASRLCVGPGGQLEVEVEERCAPFGRRVRARAVLTPEVPPLSEVCLRPGDCHFWQPRAARAHAVLEVDGEAAEGQGYHDTNHGARPLGASVPGWAWTRVHTPASTLIEYRLAEGAAPLWVEAGRGAVARSSGQEEAGAGVRRTAWGLAVPRALGPPGLGLPAPVLLESSPFYARLEAKGGSVHALGEVADWRRFHSPLVRWMAHFRTRVEEAA
jgi:carotenoid 1,2-hydratase